MIVFALSRWPGLMPLNFSAAYAVAFCAGLYFPLKLRWTLPLASLLLMDMGLNLYWGAPLFDIHIITKLFAFAGLIALGQLFRPKQSWLALTGGGILGAILFYLVTNFASWLADPAYPKTVAGLIQALTVGRPGFPPTWEFFRNTLMSGGLFTALFCGAMKLTEAADEQEEEQESEEGRQEPVPEESGA